VGTRAVLGNPDKLVTAKSRLGTPDGPTRCEQVGPLRCSRSVELAGTYPGGERGPLGRGEPQGRAGRVLGVSYGTTVMVKVGDLDALAALVTAEAACAPSCSLHC
jgi:hypothetical protein